MTKMPYDWRREAARVEAASVAEARRQRKTFQCPKCGQESPARSLGPYTVTIGCGATLFTGKPHPDSELTTTWWSFDGHKEGS